MPGPKAIVSLYGYGWANTKFFSQTHSPEATWAGIPFAVALGRADGIEAILTAKGPVLPGKEFDPSWGGARELMLPYLTATGKCKLD